MYGYEEYIEISPEQVLQKITQEQIFSWVLKENFSWTARYKSPFRAHSKDRGTCRFEQREDGTILFVDFGDLTGRTHRSCFRMVMDKERCNLTTSIKIICQHFGISTNKADYKPVIYTEYQTKTSSNRSSIIFTSKDYAKDDILLWSKWLIKVEHLEEDNVYNVRRYSITKDGKTSHFTPYKYCYAIDFLDAVKLYQPFQQDLRFITNCNEDHIGNINNLPPIGHELIIQKSYKDHRVVRNIIDGLNVCWVHNEGCIPSEEILRILINRFSLITVFFDNDPTGIINGMKLVDAFNAIKPGCARLVHFPLNMKQKDPGEFVEKEGRHDTLQLLKHILCIA
jgi:hypothetical protein